MIKGWEEGILGMKKGGRRQLVIPPQAAYGSKGMGSKVPPNSTLIFDVEVIRVRSLICTFVFDKYLPTSCTYLS